MRRLKKVLIWLAVILAVIGVTGFFIAPPIAKSVIVKNLSKALQRPVSIQGVKINPYRFTATVTRV